MKYDPKYYKCHTKNHLYNRFLDMKRRCYEPNRHNYKYYGARGIKVEAYLLNFKNYVDHLIDILPEGKTIEDMRKDKWSIDRINNDNGYVRGNLRWASLTEQVLNRRKQKNNTSGFQGVYRPKNHKKWRALIHVKNKGRHLGCFDTREEAFAVYLEAVLKYLGKEAYKNILAQHPHWEAK